MTYARRGAWTRVAALLTRWRYAVVAAWVGGALAASALLPGLEDGVPATLEGLVPENARAVQVSERSAELFRFPVLADTAVVQRNPDGLSTDAQIRALERAVALTRQPDPDATGIALAVAVTNAREIFPASRERSTTIVNYLFVQPDRSLRNRTDLAHLFASRYVSEPDDALVGVTGAAAAQVEQTQVIGESLHRVEWATVAVLAVIVALAFRSLVAPLITLFTAGVAYAVAIRALGLLGEAMGISVPRELEPVVVVLLLAIVTDYCIFFLSDFRRELNAGLPRIPAATRATANTAPIVLVAGLIVAAGTACLLAGTLGFFRAFGPGLAVTALVGMLVTLTLLPALLAIAGRAAFWPTRLGLASALTESLGEARVARRVRTSGARLTRVAVAHPVLALVVTCAVLIAAAAGLTRTSLGFTLIRGLPPDSEVRMAASAAATGFVPGILSPTEVIVELPEIGERPDELAEFQRMLAAEPGVAAVIGPADSPAQRPYGVVISPAGNAARLLVILDAAPLGGAAIRTVERLERRIPTLLARSGLASAQAGVAGATALAAETVNRTVGDLARIAVAAALVNILLLAVFLRSALAPLYLLFASVLAVSATIGLTTFVFQDLLGYGELTYSVPLVTAVLLVALGSDYNVFIVGRVWQEAKVRPLREAVGVAAPRAAREITVAGIALAASFALLALVPLRTFREVAFTMAAGVLLETFVVRSLVVPALIAFFGQAGRWPARAGSRA
jgi:RND superfamily putative drug exporter